MLLDLGQPAQALEKVRAVRWKPAPPFPGCCATGCTPPKSRWPPLPGSSPPAAAHWTSPPGKTRWDRSVIWAMLRNPAYAGRAVFGTMVLQESPGLNRVARLQGRSVPPGNQDRGPAGRGLDPRSPSRPS